VTSQTLEKPNPHSISESCPAHSYLAPYWQEIKQLPSHLEPLPLTPKLCHLAKILEVIRIEEHVGEPKRGHRGRQEIDRKPLARAFLAKTYLGISDTRKLIESLRQSPALRHLCGMRHVPSEATFSRSFAQFAKQPLGDVAHLNLLERFVSESIIMHASYDSTAVEAREKAVKKEKLAEDTPKKDWSS
jgi:transposase